MEKYSASRGRNSVTFSLGSGSLYPRGSVRFGALLGGRKTPKLYCGWSRFASGIAFLDATRKKLPKPDS